MSIPLAHRPNRTLAHYISTHTFVELRLCPCYNMMPRDLFEDMNCRPNNDASSSLSQTYLHCQAVDTTTLFAALGPHTSVRDHDFPPLPARSQH